MPETTANSSRVSTFDGRYQYDHIYPRGRSGETLRAWDPQNGNEPVVIKRPAPQDAPPMRAAQQVSIRTERKALERLAGHPVLTELRGTGSFRIGGQSHDYIVMERATGDIVEDMVLARSEHGERLPLLETLVIIDELLDLLVLAHDQQVVYNDVDAKHLFWNRDTYQLKVIDWGNAVLLDESHSNHVTRQTDVLQIGELLYFIVTGGKRLEAESTAEGDYAVIFGLDAPSAPSMLQNIITQATHPSLRRRYSTIVELRQQLSDLRRPLEDQRDVILHDVQQRLAQRNSPQELEALFDHLREAALMNPGFPRIKALHDEIEMQLQRLRTQSDIDAARIYLDTANWGRAIETMLDLLNTADEQTAPIIRFIAAAAEVLDHEDYDAAPAELSTAIDALQAGDARQAARILHDSDALINQLLAERLSVYMPDVMLLRPLLTRLRVETQSIPNPEPIISTLDVIDSWLEPQHDDAISITAVRNQYQSIQTTLGDLRAAMPNEVAERLADILRRAMEATQRIDAHLDTMARVVLSEPQRAADALHQAEEIDPHNAGFAELQGYIEEISLTIEAIAGFKPTADGSNIADWFARVLTMLDGYAADAHDERLRTVHAMLKNTADVWQQVRDTLMMGQHSAARSLLIRMARQITELNPHLAKWARDRSEQVRTSSTPESLSPNTNLGKKLLECYRLWDAGKYREAAYQVEGAYSLAQTDGELQVIKRLAELSAIPANWLENDGVADAELTTRTEKAIVALFLPEERQELDEFTATTRSESAYLKTMSRALLEPLRQYSTAATRTLFMHYTLQGLLCVQEGDLHGADFWRNVAAETQEDATTSPVFGVLSHQLEARQLMQHVERALADIQHVDQLADVQSLLKHPAAGQWLDSIAAGVRHLENAVKQWEDGEFRAAREAFDAAVEAMQAGQDTAELDLQPLLDWTEQLREIVSGLQSDRLKVEEIAHSTRIPAPGDYVEVDPRVEQTLMNIVITTEEQLGETHTHQVRQWHSTYLAVQHTYTKALPKADKLSEFQTHFANLFINRHPTFRLYQIWREVTQNLPETASSSTPPQPTASAPAPGDTENTDVVEGELLETSADHADDPAQTGTPPRRSSRGHAAPAETSAASDADDTPGFVGEDTSSQGVDFADAPTDSNDMPWGIIATVAVVLVGVIAFALFGGIGGGNDNADTAGGGGNNGNSGAAAVVPTNTSTTTATLLLPTNTDVPATATPTQGATATPQPATTEAPTSTSPPTEPPTAMATATEALPTATDTPPPTVTDAPPGAAPLTPTVVSTATTASVTADTPLSTDDSLAIDILGALNQPGAGDFSWNRVWFYPGVGGPWALGATEDSLQGGPVVVRFSEEDLATLTDTENAAERLQTVEIVMNLVVPSPTDPDSTEAIGTGIYFGLGVENADRERVAAEVQVPRPNAIAFGIRENDTYREVTDYPESNFRVTLRMERNEDGTVSLFVEENQVLGDSAANYPPGTPLLPVLYTSRDGIYIVVEEISMGFEPAS